MNRELHNVTLIVGTDRLDTFSRKYIGDSQKLVQRSLNVARKHSKVYTSESKVIRSFLLLHKIGEINLTLMYQDIQIAINKDGEFIDPWPDELFEMEFNMLFHADSYKEKLK